MPRASSAGKAAPGAGATPFALALIRIFVGVQFTAAGLGKWDWIGTPQLKVVLYKWLAAPTPAMLAWYAHFLRRIVIPHAGLFTYLIAFGELLAGLALVTGFCTRAAGLVALLLSLHYLLGAWGLGATMRNLNALTALCSFCLIVAAAGRFMGLDVLAARRSPRSPFW